MRKLLLAAVAALAVAPLSATIITVSVVAADAAEPASVAAEESAVPYSIFEVVKDTPACWPAYSDNCAMLRKGERVVFGGGDQITEYPDGRRQGLYCLRSPSMKRCGFADLTAIEINGKRGPVLGMSSKDEEQQANGSPSKPTCSPHILEPVGRCEPQGDFTKRTRRPGELPFCNSDDVQKTLTKAIGSQLVFEIQDMQTGQVDATKKRWCYTYFSSPYLASGGYRMGSPFQEAIFTLEWINQAEDRFWLQIVQQQVHRKHT